MRLIWTIKSIDQMKKYIITSLSAIVLATGCMAPSNNTERGAVLGGILGAVIGHNTKGKKTAEGAAIGALGGAVLGGALGNAQDKKAGNK